MSKLCNVIIKAHDDPLHPHVILHCFLNSLFCCYVPAATEDMSAAAVTAVRKTFRRLSISPCHRCCHDPWVETTKTFFATQGPTNKVL